MHEHVGDELPRIEILRRDVMQAQPSSQVYAPCLEADIGKEKKHVDYQKVLYYGRQETESPERVVVALLLVHFLLFFSV